MAAFELRSPVFEQNGTIPRDYTCEGKNLSPPLEWSGAPENTKSYALVVDDPDAPNGTFTHWLLFDIPAEQGGVPADVPHTGKLTDGRTQGRNDFEREGWDGPMPPKGHGPHRYFFKLYALDAPLGLDTGVTKRELGAAMRGHVLAETELVARYERA
jgi:Raf kinase inhibitor-like YbhB/YbcL family protein